MAECLDRLYPLPNPRTRLEQLRQPEFSVKCRKQYFANNILGVLFTHCHNLILQILAEMGLTGALLSAGTMLAGVWRLIARPSNPANLFLLTAASVTMCHSMLEYPLWYIYFLAPFALMLSLSSARYEDVSDGIKQARRRNLAGGIAALAIIGGTLHLGWNYTDLTAYSRQPKTDGPSQANAKISGLRRISETSPMLAYYADLSLTRRADPTDEKSNLGRKSGIRRTHLPPLQQCLPSRPLPLPSR